MLSLRCDSECRAKEERETLREDRRGRRTKICVTGTRQEGGTQETKASEDNGRHLPWLTVALLGGKDP